MSITGQVALPGHTEQGDEVEKAPASHGPLHPLSIWKRLKHDKPALFGAAIVIVFIFLALAGPLISPHSPFERDTALSNEPPSWVTPPAYWDSSRQPTTIFGRDVAGRDIFSRVIAGTRTSLLLGLAVVLIASFIGVTLGSIAGYLGGFADTMVMRLVDILLAFPFLILALAMISIVPQVTPPLIALVLGITSWPGICRLMRGQVLTTRELDFVNAARALGAGHTAILLRHVLPNCIGPVIIWFSMGIAGAIMAEASLSFLVVGDADSTSWGTMIFIGLTKANFPTEWWAVTFPALALAMLVFGFNLLGDGLQDAINPRLKK